MTRAEELAYKMINYMKQYDLYDYNDNYETDEEAFDNLVPLYNSEKGIRKQIEELAENLSILATEKDLKDKEMSKLFNSSISLIKDFSDYYGVYSKTNEVMI